MNLYTRNLEELLYLSAQKHNMVRNLIKNYKENIHYIIKNDIINKKGSGGKNKVDYLLTEQAYDLLKNSYNLRNKYIVNVSNNVTQINLCMCIENQTIGFIENAYKNILYIKRQFYIGKYRTDLYFVDYKLVIECDEFNHKDRDITEEKIREDYILSFGNKIIRYNPNDKLFDVSNVLNQINTILFSKL